MILAELIADFEIRCAEIDERPLSGESASQTAVRLAFQKAETVSKQIESALVIGADTVVSLNGKTMGKPEDENDAEKMLGLLSGKTHEVITGVAFVQKAEKIKKIVYCNSAVTFRPLGEADIKNYIQSGEYRGKAGAYAIQGLGRSLMDSYSGSFTNIVGLPMRELLRFFAQYGLDRLPLRGVQ